MIYNNGVINGEDKVIAWNGNNKEEIFELLHKDESVLFFDDGVVKIPYEDDFLFLLKGDILFRDIFDNFFVISCKKETSYNKK